MPDSPFDAGELPPPAASARPPKASESVPDARSREENLSGREGETAAERAAAREHPLLQRLMAFETVLMAGGVILFLLLLYEMSGFLNPPLIAGAGALLLWPLREHRAVQALMVSGGFLLLLWLLAELSAVLAPFAIVYVLAYLFEPAVHYLQERFGVRRWISALVVALLVVGALALVTLLLVPSVVGQVEVLAERALESVQGLRDWLQQSALLANMEAAGLVNRAALAEQINGMVQAQSRRLASGLPEAAQGLVQSLGSVFGVVTAIAIVPVLLFYTLKDYPVLSDRLIGLFPTFGGRRDYLVKAGSIVGNYLRGQLTICAIAAVNVSVVLYLFGVPFSLLIGVMAGVLNLIPNLGAIITMVVAGLIALIFGDPWLIDLIVVLAALVGQSLLETSVLTPNILSYQVGLHPVLILLSLFVFGYFLGIFGLLIAVPATALLMTLYKSHRQDLTLDLELFHAPPRADRSSSE